MRIRFSTEVIFILLALASRLPGGGQVGVESSVTPKLDEWPQQLQHALDLESVGDFVAAERTLTKSVHNAEQPGSDPAWLPTALDRLGLLNWNLGRSRQAEKLYLRSADLWGSRFGPGNLGLATTLSDLAWAYVGLGDSARAEALWRRSLEIQKATFGPSHPRVAQVYGYLAVAAFGANRLDEAESYCEQALVIYDRAGQVPGETDQVLSSLASVRLRQGRALEAVQLMTEAIQLELTAQHRSIRLLAGYFYSLALAESSAEQPSQAEAHFEHALSLLAAPPYATQTLRFNVLTSYARFLSCAGRKKEARSVQKRASNLEPVIRRESHSEYVADVSTFR